MTRGRWSPIAGSVLKLFTGDLQAGYMQRTHVERSCILAQADSLYCRVLAQRAAESAAQMAGKSNWACTGRGESHVLVVVPSPTV